jgi:LPS-assembly protein
LRPADISGKVVLVLFLLLLSAVTAAAVDRLPEAGITDIEAVHLVYDREHNRYVASGEVVITRREMVLKADRAILDNNRREFEAWGHVLLDDGGNYLACRYLRFQIDSQTGVIQDGRIFLRDKHFYITGREINKLGPEEYTASEATLTTCDAAKPAWMIRCDTVKIDREGYAVVDDAVFAVKNVPVVWLPKGIFPVNTKRNSGFLLPYAGYGSEDGVIIKNAYFWAIDDSHDATFYLDWYGKRGLMPGAEYRYVLGENAHGELRGSWISDDQVDDDKPRYTDADTDRWSLGWRHYQDFASGWWARAAVQLVSDNMFLEDFPDAFTSSFIDELDDADWETDRDLRSSVYGAKSWQRFNVTLDMQYYDSLILENNDDVLQQLPELTLTAFRQPLGASPLFWDLTAVYTHFWREEGMRGQRFDIRPQLVLPVQLGAFTLTTALAGRETAWLTENDDRGGGSDSDSREMLEAEVMLETTLARVYNVQAFGLDRLKHTLEPAVVYRYVPDVDQDEMPFFDRYDRIYQQNNIRYGFLSRLIGRYRQAGGEYGYHQYFRGGIWQVFNLVDDPNGDEFITAGRDFSAIDLELEWWGRRYLYAKVEGAYDPEETRLDTFAALGRLTGATDSRYLQLEYRYDRLWLDEFIASGYLPVLTALDLYGSLRYSVDDDFAWEKVYGINYHPQCWALDFSVSEERRPYDITFRALLSFYGLGSLGQ